MGKKEEKTITIRDFPVDLHKRAKAKAAMGEISLRQLFINAVTEYLKKKGGE